jgi:hypothetical protein
VCGNGVITGAEECESGIGCNTTTCKCEAGYQPYIIRQQCRRVPADFIPSVGPSLDCLNIIDDSYMKLFFSFVNNNGFDQTILFGELNKFVPTNFAVSLFLTYWLDFVNGVY